LLLRRGGGVADALIARLKPGAVVEFDGPLGPGFPLERGRGRDVLCAAAGSAISPIRALLEAVADERDAYGRVVLFYGQERADEFAYEASRNALATHGVEIVLCAHAPEGDWRGERGFVQDVIVAGGARVDTAGAVAYLCGMPGMVSGVREALAGLGLTADRTFLNY
jgi:NAD(P)H-flavin reductase